MGADVVAFACACQVDAFGRPNVAHVNYAPAALAAAEANPSAHFDSLVRNSTQLVNYSLSYLAIFTFENMASSLV